MGAGVVVSQVLGAKDREGAHTAVHTSLALSAILGAILTVCGIAVSRALLTAMNTPAEVLEDAVLYMRLYFGGVLFSVVYNMAAGILNAAGKRVVEFDRIMSNPTYAKAQEAWPGRPLPPISASWCPVCSPCAF